MDANLATAVITAAISLGGSWWVTRADRKRVSSLERRIDKSERKDRKWWLWAQQVVTIYGQWRKENSPELPPIPIDEEAIN